jgi:hypothetical protein
MFLRRYLLYLLRWQLSTPILAPIVAYFKHSPSLFGTAEDWLGATVANLVGGMLFFFVDRLIFRGIDGPLWMVKSAVPCHDCGVVGRGYRLVKSGPYDRSRDAAEYRCEACSGRKADALTASGVTTE